MIKKILSLAAVAVLSGTAFGQGMRGGAGMMRMMQGTTAQSLMLLRREDVQSEIKMTDDQKGKLDSLQSGAQDKFRAAFANMRQNAGGGGDPEAMMKAAQTTMAALFEDLSKDALAILEPDQKKRLKELVVQAQGTLAVLQPDVDKEIGGLTPGQKAQIDDLQRRQDEANRNLIEQVQGGEIDREDMGNKMEANRKIMDQAVGKLLTEPQRAKLKEMSGKAFEFKDPKPGTPGAWGRPGGGGR